MRILTILASILLGPFVVSAPVIAQGTPAASYADVDIEAIAEATLSADLDTMIEDLKQPLADTELPENFSSAEYVPADQVTDDDLVLPMEDLAFAEDSAGFNVDYEPRANGLTIGLASLNYIFVDGEITDENLEDFKRGAAQGVDSNVKVTDIEVNGVPAVLVSVELEENGIISVVQMIAVPVGNTMVLSMVVAASDDPTLDARGVRSDARDLALAGIVHLGVVAESAR
jgi:hypothetical protein